MCVKLKLQSLVHHSFLIFSDLPGSLQAAVRCLLDDTDYVSVVRAAMVGGG